MIAYFAAGAASVAKRLLAGKRALVSFAMIPKWIKPGDIDDLSDSCAGLFLDSGAFTAWKQGNPVDLGAYCAFIDQRRQLFASIAALDEIGDHVASIRNWQAMRARGIDAMPVFHEGEPISVLDEYCAESQSVGLGRTDGRGDKRKSLEFYDLAFNRHPDQKFHAFGCSDPVLLEPYPFASFDSTTWERDSAYGNKHGFPLSAVTKEIRMRVYIEAIETIRHRPRSQLTLDQKFAQLAIPESP